MKKKTSAKKASEKEKRKQFEKEVRQALSAPRKAVAKKKETKDKAKAKGKYASEEKRKSKSFGKTGPARKKTEVKKTDKDKGRKKKSVAKILRKITAKTAASAKKARVKKPQKPVSGIKAKTPLRTVKAKTQGKIKKTTKVREEGRVRAVPKGTAVTKAKKDAEARTKAKVRKKEKPKARIERAPKRGTAPKTAVKKEEKILPAKPVIEKKAAQIKKPDMGIAVPPKPEKKKIAKKTVKEKVLPGVEKKISDRKVRKVKKVPVAETIKKMPEQMVQQPSVPMGMARPYEIKAEQEVPYEVEAGYQPIPVGTLPAEYGENSITLMTVDPHKLFVYWEVREETLRIFPGDIVIRLYDVTGIDLHRTEAAGCTEIPVHERIGSTYMDVDPAREYIVDIGIAYEGIFIAVARSLRASTPVAAVLEKGLLPDLLSETGFRTGY